PDHPVLIDHFLRRAIEVDVDCVADGREAVVAGIMEHIEEAGVHSGDSACSLPPYSISPEVVAEIERQTILMALALGVKGLMNVQFAVQGQDIFILEVNPRASRTVPFVAKATGVPFAKIAARLMAGEMLSDTGPRARPQPKHIAVKEAVFPFEKFPGVDTVLGPEMKSTGEVMGLADSFPVAFVKAQDGAGTLLPVPGKWNVEQKALISVKDEDKALVVEPARRLLEMGIRICATEGTALYLESQGIPVDRVRKVTQPRPHIVDAMKNREIALVFNTTRDKKAQVDSFPIRRTALMMGIPYFTTVEGMKAAVEAMTVPAATRFHCKALQDYY
ncbi:MAG: ATP-grasp domain-containing protein, partial [Magnetococcales bacterium]|nr:ATP-grasp domain-containing protein [Magnetococcales bacterium]